MSKRLQVLIPDKEYTALLQLCREKAITVAQWVRESLRNNLIQNQPESPEKKIARLLKYAKYKGPTGDIDQILSEIESGQKIKI